jgi:glycosyltransferase involved in cell wall biosynthesis
VVLSVDSTKIISREIELLSKGVKVIRTCGITGKGIIGRLRHLVLLYKVLKRERPDIFQTNIDLFNGPNLFIAWFAGVPVRICHSHNSMQEREASGGRNIAIDLYQGVMRWLCWTFSNRRAGCSEAALDFLFTDKWKTDPRAIVVNNGIDIKNFCTGIDPKKKLKEVGSDSKYNVLTVGRISPQKNPIFIATIFIELCKKRNDCSLIWAGIGEMEDQVKMLLHENNVLDKVHFLGSRDDVNELMQSCDAFLFPSLFEGLGIVAIEAQAAGLPCLISDTVPSMVDCGGCEFHSLNESSEQWSYYLNDILDGTTKFTIDEKKLNKYSIEHMVEQMETLFD